MDESGSEREFGKDRFSTIPVEILVSVGRARPLVRDLAALGENAVLPLDHRVEDPVDLYVGEQLIARGRLEEMEGGSAGRLSVRIEEILDIRQRRE